LVVVFKSRDCETHHNNNSITLQNTHSWQVEKRYSRVGCGTGKTRLDAREKKHRRDRESGQVHTQGTRINRSVSKMWYTAGEYGEWATRGGSIRLIDVCMSIRWTNWLAVAKTSIFEIHSLVVMG
jgi:hypothetical protein